MRRLRLRRIGGDKPNQKESAKMHMMLKILIPTEAGNHAIKDGSLHKIFEATMSRIKPEGCLLRSRTWSALCNDVL
jgi:hypothetical protein